MDPLKRFQHPMLVGVAQPPRHLTHPVELLLQLLVGVVDAELFEAVPLKCLEPAPTEKPSTTFKEKVFCPPRKKTQELMTNP